MEPAGGRRGDGLGDFEDALELGEDVGAGVVQGAGAGVEELLGGDLNKAEELFRMGLTKDPRDTGIRLGLGKTLMKRGRYAEARRELQAILDEPSPRNVADWTLKDSKTARELLDSIKNES